METRPLGHTDLRISLITLGTMTWGEQNTEAEAHAQMDRAIAAGVNLFDAAEMYPVPPRPETYGLTETFIGTWLKRHGRPDGLMIASKVIGPGAFPYIRGGPLLKREQVIAACEASLKRLQTDVIDLYQVHWPERGTNYFGKLGYIPDERGSTPVEETLRALADLQAAGKIRHIGISNETPWGLSEYLRLSREAGLPRVVSVQNPYSLLNRSYEIGLAEFAHRERVGLLAYSPLAFGMLSGKYLGGARPEGSRWTMMQRNGLFRDTEASSAAIAAYVALAEKHGMSASQLAIAWCDQVDGVTSTIIGATTMEQLQEDIDAFDIEFNDELKGEVAELVKRFTVPF